MAPRQPPYKVQKRRATSTPPREVTNDTPRRSKRLQVIEQHILLETSRPPAQGRNPFPFVHQTHKPNRNHLPSPESNSPPDHISRKRSRLESELLSDPSPKRLQFSRGQLPSQASACGHVEESCRGPTEYWVKNHCWPKTYFEDHEMSHLLARKKSSSSLSRTRRSESASTADSATSSNQPREQKSAPYRDARYETLLATKGSFMAKSSLDITPESKRLCQELLKYDQCISLPQDSLFRDDIFEKTCDKIRNRNEARVIQDIGRLIVPSAEHLACFGAAELDGLIESVNEGWNNSIAITPTRPQPDYAVAFSRQAFTDEQLRKLQPFTGSPYEASYFMGTYYQHFPFFTCEVKCGASALEVADRQNAHSMTMAVRAVVELFRLVGRESELHREIVAFSVSHDNSMVRLYGHYPIIDGQNTTYYRHPIHSFDFTSLEGRDKWTAYTFTTNVFKTWMPAHLQRICSVIDQLPPDISFDVTSQSGLTENSGLSQGLQAYHIPGSEADSVSTARDESQPVLTGQEDLTPNTSFTDRQASRSRKRRAGQARVENHG